MAGKRLVLNYTHPLAQAELQKVKVFAPLSIKQEKFLQDKTNDIVVWGGAASAGKTQLSLMSIMLGATYDGDYVAGIVRNSQKQMKGPGSLWSSGCKMFAEFGVTSNKIELSWNFPSGAEVKCHHLNQNTEDFQGTQCTRYLVDESQQCREDDVWYLTSRLRSMSSQKHQLILTANPDKNSFLCSWLVKAGYIGEDGLPLESMDGVTTYMVQSAGEFQWFATLKDVEDAFGKDVANTAQKFVFYSANVYDNPFICKHLPEYVTKLENLKHVERQRLLLGNWFVTLEGEGYIKREWFDEIPLSQVPLGKPTVRAYDFAATKPSDANKDPDFTRGIRATFDKDTGHFYITDLVSERDRPAVVQMLVETTAQRDGKEVYIAIPQDAGAAGVESVQAKQARLSKLGHKVLVCKARANKATRAEPFLIALQGGMVHVVKGVFTDEHYRELENFDGIKNGGLHDDIVDALSDAFTCLTARQFVPTIRMGGTGNTSNALSQLGGKTLL